VVEAGISAVIAVCAAAAAVTNRMHSRITNLDNRVDNVQLSMVRDYVSKDEYAATMLEIKEHVIRIESKLDSFIQDYPRR